MALLPPFGMPAGESPPGTISNSAFAPGGGPNGMVAAFAFPADAHSARRNPAQRRRGSWTLPPSLAPIEILADGRAARIGAHSTRQTPSGFPAVISTPLGNLP